MDAVETSSHRRVLEHPVLVSALPHAAVVPLAATLGVSACPLLDGAGHAALMGIMAVVATIGWAGYWAGSLGWARSWKRLVHGAPIDSVAPDVLLHGPARGVVAHAVAFVAGTAVGAVLLSVVFGHAVTNARFWIAALVSGGAIVVLNAVLMEFLLARSLARLETRGWRYRRPPSEVAVREIALVALAVLPVAVMTLLVNRRVVLEGARLEGEELVGWLVRIGALFVAWSVLTSLLLRGIERRASSEALRLIRRLDAPEIELRAHMASGGAWGETVSALNVAADRLEERTRLERAVRTYVGDELAEASRSTDVTQRCGERVRMTVLFADIRGFTRRSADADPQDVVALLDRYFERAVEAVAAHDGHVDKFIGDGLMAWFEERPGCDDLGAPRAHAAGRRLLEEVRLLNLELTREGSAPIEVGVGLHAGEVVRGNLGAGRRKQWTVIGDTVNLASRLESLTKEIARPLVYTAAVASRVPRSASLALGDVEVRGQPRPVAVFAAAPASGGEMPQEL